MMNDLDLLNDLGQALDPTPADAPARLHHRIAQQLEDESGRGRRLTPGRRRALWAIPTTVVAATAAATVVAVVGFGIGIAGPEHGPRDLGTASAVTVLQQGSFASGAEGSQQARAVLLTAASRARSQQPSSVPDPNAYVYTRSKEVGTAQIDGEWQGYADEREAWFSVDGRSVSAVTPSGSTRLTKINDCAYDCAGYFPDLPTTPDGALAYLRQVPDGVLNDQEVFNRAGSLLHEKLVPPAARAAILEAVSQLRGVTTLRETTTITGRPGLAVGLVVNEGWEYDQLVFDPTTKELIGMQNTTITARGGLAAGSVLYGMAALDKTVVKDLRLRPDGSIRPGPIDG
jgi:hypothetical protein